MRENIRKSSGPKALAGSFPRHRPRPGRGPTMAPGRKNPDALEVRVEAGRGGLGHVASRRCPAPPIEPDARRCRVDRPLPAVPLHEGVGHPSRSVRPLLRAVEDMLSTARRAIH